MASSPLFARHDRLLILAPALLLGALAMSGHGRDSAPSKQETSPSEEAERLFQQTVLPLLKQKCFACHGDDAHKVRSDLDLRTRAGMLAGGKGGEAVLVPGEPEKSMLYIAITRRNPDRAMPPKETEKLDAKQVQAVRDTWVCIRSESSDIQVTSHDLPPRDAAGRCRTPCIPDRSARGWSAG
jgi:mono/diheme cytochrome c family protein